MQGKYYLEAEGKANQVIYAATYSDKESCQKHAAQITSHQNKVSTRYEKIIELDYKMLFKSLFEVFPLKNTTKAWLGL